MDDQRAHREARRFLGIECGATHTIVLLEDGTRVMRREIGPANVQLLTDAQLARHFRNIRAMHAAFTRPSAIGIGMAGARTESDRARIRLAASKVWPRVPCYATNDLETAMLAAEPGAPFQGRQARKSRI